MTGDLFGHATVNLLIGPGAMLLHGFALGRAPALLAELATVTTAAPFRHFRTPGGLRMSAAMTGCGACCWVSDRRGYRYEPLDPDSGLPWPRMPAGFSALAAEAAAAAGFAGFSPDACLVNRYEPGTKLSLHQDRDERDFEAPIVSVSFGLPAVFLWGGTERSAKVTRIPLVHGDVVAWGGPSRLYFHGVAPLRPGQHLELGSCRINLTFRKAL